MAKKKEGKSMNFKGKMQRKSGITLISLVVTIIVLLILAGVAIATLTGNNGILIRTQEAKNKSKQANTDELRKLTQLEAITQLEDYEYTDKNGEKVNIPAKCAVSQVEGENTLENGLVIIDINGNEWVWISVPENEMPDGLTFEDNEDYNTLKIALKNYTNNYTRLDFIDEWYDVDGNNASESSNLEDRLGCGLTNEEYNTLYNKMLKSIYQNSGFWIGRYEAASTEPRLASQELIENVKIQKEMYPYTFISCAEAQSLASQISSDTQKTGSLLFGIQWDLVCKFLEVKGLELDEIKSNSKNWGNYSDSTFSVSNGKYAIHNKSTNNLGEWKKVTQSYTKMDEGEENSVLFSTGITDRNEKMNIYDLAGNVGEYTLERSITIGIPCVTRGGVFRNSGYVAQRGIYDTNNKLSSSISFRITMY